MDITLDLANKIVAAALQSASEAGHKPMAVVVLDSSGRINLRIAATRSR